MVSPFITKEGVFRLDMDGDDANLAEDDTGVEDVERRVVKLKGADEDNILEELEADQPRWPCTPFGHSYSPRILTSPSPFGAATRGPRERAEDIERERRRKDKDMMRLRSDNLSAYDTFHSAPAVNTTSQPGGNAWPLGQPLQLGCPNPTRDVPVFFVPATPAERQHFIEQARHDPQYGALHNHASSESSSSSVVGGQSAGREEDGDVDLTRALSGLDLNTEGGKTSPQLPSPASGASSRNGVDQNPPINTLYVGNLPTSSPPNGFPQDYLEESLRELFSMRAGFYVPYATKALNELYGDTLKGLVKGGIRLSYSKNPLGVRTPTSAGSNGPLTATTTNAEPRRYLILEFFRARISIAERRAAAIACSADDSSS
ncbi:hypothetical protein DXG01_000856 [Tephrocybe rancida]|nr:hypothetical protein DXG01_000856 [Tephrocybe rancida]